MMHRKGFTLMEVLLAVLIVGLIGVALASLTKAASRQVSVGGTRGVLRNNISTAMRQLRQDAHEATQVLWVGSSMASAPTTLYTPLLVLAKNVDAAGNDIVERSVSNNNRWYVAYCFKGGSRTTFSSGIRVQPFNKSTDGGEILRITWKGAAPTYVGVCNTTTASGQSNKSYHTWLSNVKFISNSYTFTVGAQSKTYPVPLFELNNFKTTDSVGGTFGSADWGKGAVLTARLILELDAFPVVNESVEEQVVINGGGIL